MADDVIQFVPVPKELVASLPPTCLGLALYLYDRAHSTRWKRPLRLDGERELSRRFGMSRADVRTTLSTISDLGLGSVERMMAGKRVNGSTLHLERPTRNHEPNHGSPHDEQADSDSEPRAKPRKGRNHGADHGADHGRNHGTPDSERIDSDSEPRAKPRREPPPKPPIGMRPETYTRDLEEEHMSDRHAAAKRQAEQEDLWQELCSMWDSFKSRDPGTTARRLKRTRGQGEELWKMRTKRKREDLKLVLDYIQSGATSHALNFRDDYDTHPVNVRRNLDKWADMARDCADGLTATSGGAITAEAEKAWAAVLKAIPKSHKSPTKVSEDPARNAAAITAMRAVGVQNIRRANHFDQRAMKPAFCEAYAVARRER